jgi:UDP-glucose 4-epimerase
MGSFYPSPRVTFYEVDILNIERNSEIFADADLVLHFAGIGDIVPSIENPIDYMEVNLTGTLNVLEASRFAGVRRFVYAASSSCYGSRPELPTTESCEINNEYPYALSKYLGEQSSFHWMKVYGLSVNSIRIFNAYGLRSKTTGQYGAVFGVFLRQKLAGTAFTVVGDGSQKRDFVFATDVAEAFVAAGETDLSGKIWNVGGGHPKSISDLVAFLGGSSVSIPNRPGEPYTTWADTSAIKRDLAWEPKVSFEMGVRIVLDNIGFWAKAPLWDEQSISKATETWFKHLSPKEKG